MTFAKTADGHPFALHDVMEQWAKNRLSTAMALRLSGFNSVIDLMQCTLEHGIDLEMNLTADEKRQASKFAEVMRKAGFGQDSKDPQRDCDTSRNSRQEEPDPSRRLACSTALLQSHRRRAAKGDGGIVSAIFYRECFDQGDAMNAHDITEHANLLHHRIYAEQIRNNPHLIKRAISMLEDRVAHNGETVGERIWLKLLKGPWPKAEVLMLSETEKGRLLRSNSPFAMLIGISDINERMALWRQARTELSRRKT